MYELWQTIEALLMSSREPLSLERMQQAFEEHERPSKDSLQLALQQLMTAYATHSFELVMLATGYQIQTKARYSPWILRLQMEKPSKYSRALLETLAIIAYKQPVTRAEIEAIRGVTVSSAIIKTLLEREWIRVAGFKDLPGKPGVYVTTKQFLNYFNLQDLNQLPSFSECITNE
jgi:segregation and condensation protein B